MGKRHITLPDSLDSLFIRLEELILANSGENDFEEIFKLVLAKLWDERNNCRMFHSTTDEMSNFENINKLLGMVRKEWSEVLYEPFTKLSPQHLYICTNLLSNFRLTSYSFEALDALFEYIVSKTAKGSKGQFFTPRHVVDFCVRILSPRSNETILDPACGSGAFLLHAFKYIHSTTDIIQTENFWGFDYDDKAVRIARTLLYLGGIRNPNIFKVNSLLLPNLQEKVLFNSIGEGITTIEDHLRLSRMEKLFDIIITNPPFAGEITENEILKSYETSLNRTRIERDTLFIERCVKLLKPGGRMAIVLPNNKFGGKDLVELRKWLLKHARIVGVVSLPRSTFMPHTSVKTSILFIQKRLSERTKTTSENIFIGISENIGKDSRGLLEYLTDDNQSWENVNHDLKDIEIEFKQFLVNENIGWCSNWQLQP